MTVQQIDWSGLERRATPRRSGYRDYGVTKLMNVLHAKELGRRLAGTRVTTYALHPGVVASNIWRALPLPLQWLGKLFMLSNEQGAESPLYCATAPELAATTGRYYDRMREVRPSPRPGTGALGQNRSGGGIRDLSAATRAPPWRRCPRCASSRPCRRSFRSGS